MNSERPCRAKAVVGPTGEPLTINDLPPPDTRRWVIRRTAEVIVAIRGGLINRDEACERYGISDDELLSWEDLLDRQGVRGLRTTRLQEYRGSSQRSANGQDDPADRRPSHKSNGALDSPSTAFIQ